MSEVKEAIIIEDESEDDDTEELYQSVFIKTEETCIFCQVRTRPSTDIERKVGIFHIFCNFLIL